MEFSLFLSKFGKETSKGEKGFGYLDPKLTIQCVVDYSRQRKMKIIIGFIASSRLIRLELIYTPKIG
ncbi:hypothetical protein V6Z12_A07G253400 [Gossypium hirsutum]